jgi:hypothetical protein
MDKEKKVNNKKQIKILKYEEHPEFVGNEIEVAIMNNEKRKPIVKKQTTPEKPKPRMTINQLATIVEKQGTKLDQLAEIVTNLTVEMRAGFADIKVILERHEEILMRHENILKKHESIFERNNLK